MASPVSFLLSDISKELCVQQFRRCFTRTDRQTERQTDKQIDRQMKPFSFTSEEM